ncbi:MAG: leucyl/phenylalanyl-tRNA--protein transferase [Ignavibacteriae bacterium HGW-Ignavibacteriae-2]|jgi:leucyl/phenylalanyl-tRNA--protein transferase|nr:MAG: leucyl/phenylalanyl-tRNA--protein transferase [Ignavibacteriae bacterium HGW-Ignavibacteriae-2]
MQRKDFDKKILLEPENMLHMYARGAFPMADLNGEIDWYMPRTRSIIPLDGYNFPRTLRKFMEKSDFVYEFDLNTIEVVEHCASRQQTWITPELVQAYKGLYSMGNLHSVEIYKDNLLVGGLYGVTYKGAFFGESMFSYVSQASKAALIKLIKRLRKKGFVLLDIQFTTDHLKMFGSKEISFTEFERLLLNAYRKEVSF